MEDKLKKLQENIEQQYCGDYGTLEYEIEETLWLILDILQELKKLKESDKNENNR